MGNGQTRWFEVTGVMALLLAFAFYMFRWGLEGAVHNRKVQIVPDLKGKSLPAALDVISPLDLALRKEGTEFNGSVPIGTVLRQVPPAGTKVREGKIVNLVISQGGETVFVPTLTGLPLRNAEMLLRENQLALGQITESYSLRMVKGMVLSQDPKSESSVGRDSSVNVVISGGSPPGGIVLMPDFSGKSVDDAIAWSQQGGIRLEVVKDTASLFPYGTILAQEPQSDSPVGADAKVRLTISGKSGGASRETAEKKFHYAVPQGSTDSQVRIVLESKSGERELFSGMRSPGSKVEVSIPAEESRQSRVKVYLNGILVEEQEW